MDKVAADGALRGCACLLTQHTGPHWLHMDLLTLRASRKLLEAGNWRGFTATEEARLEQKLYDMSAAGIRPDETVWAWMARRGWPGTVIAEYEAAYRAERQGIATAVRVMWDVPMRAGQKEGPRP